MAMSRLAGFFITSTSTRLSPMRKNFFRTSPPSPHRAELQRRSSGFEREDLPSVQLTFVQLAAGLPTAVFARTQMGVLSLWTMSRTTLVVFDTPHHASFFVHCRKVPRIEVSHGKISACHFRCDLTHSYRGKRNTLSRPELLPNTNFLATSVV